MTIMLCVSFARAANPSVQTFPVPIGVDGSPICSSMLLQFRYQPYDVPCESFSADRVDRYEVAFRDFITALRHGDTKKVSTLRPGDRSDQAQDIMGHFRGAFAPSLKTRLVGRVFAGDDQVFVWEVPREGGAMRRAFSVHAPANEPARVDIVYSGNPLQTLIVDVFQKQLEGPSKCVAVEPKGRYRYDFPLNGPGKTGKYPVSLIFDGAPVNVELLQVKDSPGDSKATQRGAEGVRVDDAVSAYRGALEALKACDIERYCRWFTDKSKEKLKSWFQKLTGEELGSHCEKMSQPQTLRFVLDAGPVKLVLYTTGSQTTVHYQYLVKDKDGYKLTNAYMQNFVDDVIGNKALFPIELDALEKLVPTAKESR